MNWASRVDSAFPQLLQVILRGVGQVFFCCNALTGLIFLIALFIGGVAAGAAATAGVVTSTMTVHLLGFSKKDIDAGLYGFNGTLVGPCLFLFLEHSPQLWLYVILASILSSVVLAALMRILRPYQVPASTAPFVLTSWMFLVAVYGFESFTRSPVLPAAGIPAAVPGANGLSVENWPVALFKGVGEVMFADSVTVGILFLAGIAIVSLRGALMAISGAFVGIIFPTLLNANLNAIEMGLYAFNPVLTMMAIGWVFLKPSGKSTALAVLAGVMTVVCQAGLASFLTPIGLPTLTFPFVLVMWMFLFAAGMSKYWVDPDAEEE